MKHKNNKTKALVSMIFAFILTVLLVILFVSFGLGIGVFNSRSITKSINKTDYYDKVYRDVAQRAGDILSQVGLPDTLLSEIITPGRVHADGMNYVYEAIKGRQQPDIRDDEKTQTQVQYPLHKEINSHIQEYLELESVSQLNGLALSDRVSTVVEALEYEYNSRVQLRYVDYLMSYRADYNRLMPVMILVLFLLIGTLCYTLIRMYHHRYRGLRYIIYALLASSLLTLTPTLYLLHSKNYNKLMTSLIMAEHDYYQRFISEYLRLSISVFVYIGLMALLIAIMLITLVGIIKNKIMKSIKY